MAHFDSDLKVAHFDYDMILGHFDSDIKLGHFDLTRLILDIDSEAERVKIRS